MDNKQALRQMGQRRRQALAPGGSLSGPLQPLLDDARRVAAYVPVGDEPGVPPQLGWLLPVLLPGGDLDWAEFTGELQQTTRGLREPVGPRLGVDAIADCDLVLVPALLVDRHGNRLGKGGGSYDRALPRATGLTVALLYDGELVDTLPAEAHDVRVAAVATPLGGLVRLSGS
ncbi:MAG: 5-formyltetrahydrofolate cyclo-ligase [Frankiales bacterium]|nr:5-formyltetrahydrofolate cyclo-ligase [Frankiales bacterium]